MKTKLIKKVEDAIYHGLDICNTNNKSENGLSSIAVARINVLGLDEYWNIVSDNTNALNQRGVSLVARAFIMHHKDHIKRKIESMMRFRCIAVLAILCAISSTIIRFIIKNI